ncbi:nicotinate mononucleotide-dependent phosphoribosyltransferase CobT [Leptolyngbya sp. GGD]|uniref:nicotinate mononucleotide-dependent phosphoribosyltransferase CobT n=1 Tax=Leptolyngbya sp. GGD TaxID=2997907 RepID=UPI00227D2734|nr:TIGR00303 family protein [Leptolyngbya sp. GGD]MCY6491629.1 TIGR00303 family protein [Leptolyngbya sp. GGD]
MIDALAIYTEVDRAKAWIARNQGKKPHFACILGFTDTGLIPGISAAGATPHDRQFTAIADAEFLVNGIQPNPEFPLPPLHVGISPVFISRAVIEALKIPVTVLNAGLPRSPAILAVDLGGAPARCVSTGNAIDLQIVHHLFNQGLKWGEKLAQSADYLVLGECVVGGTTTALAVLTGLGIDAIGKINSSHPVCNHTQKWELVQQGLRQSHCNQVGDPFAVVAAVGDPMQIVVAGMTIAASRICGVLLAGGTQMLAVYALAEAIVQTKAIAWNPEQILIGTTRWVAEDPTGDTVGLAKTLQNVSLIATRLSFAESRWKALQMYEQGFVKEGVGAGGCAIAATVFQSWGQAELLAAIEHLIEQRNQQIE